MERDVSFAVSTLGRLAGVGGVDAAFLRDHLRLPLRLLQAEPGRLPSP
jgi:hypothetical protein